MWGEGDGGKEGGNGYNVGGEWVRKRRGKIFVREGQGDERADCEEKKESEFSLY